MVSCSRGFVKYTIAILGPIHFWRWQAPKESNMRVSDDRYSRDWLRLDLALRFLSHGARTHTIRAWTMLSDDRIRKLYRSYVRTADSPPRHRGKSPQQVSFFMRGARAQQETGMLASFFSLLGVVPTTKLTEVNH